MRYTVLFFILFISCQRELSANLIIDIKPGDSTVKTEIMQYPFKLYKKSKFYRKIPLPELPVRLPQKVKLDSLENGNYVLEYPDMFGNIIKKDINIQESKTYKVTIYPDITKKFSNKNIISNLKDGEDLEIKMNSMGCFHSSSSSFHIFKKNNQLEISRNNISIVLNKKQEKYLINLENSIRLLDDGGCTTRENIIFVLKDKTDTITDSGCQFQSLKKFAEFLKSSGL